MERWIPGIKEMRLNESGSFTFLCALLTVTIIPLHYQFLPPVMILWFLCWILEKRNSQDQIWDKGSGIFILFVAFLFYYLWQCIGLTYSSDLKMGKSNIFSRLSLLVFPLVLSSPGQLIRKNTRLFLKVFAFATVTYMVFCYGFALSRSVILKDGAMTFDPHIPEYPWLSYFYGADLSFSIHPSYLSIYVLFSTFILFEAGIQTQNNKHIKIIWFIAAIFLLVSLYFLSSRAGILAAILLIPGYFYFKLRNKKVRTLVMCSILLLMIISLPLLMKNQRVRYLYDRIVKNETVGENRQDPRMMIWKSSFHLIGENLLFGVGIGDVRHELTKEYKKMGEEDMVMKKLNAHNQFIEVLLENGIIGLALFLFILISMFRLAFSGKNILYWMFLLVILIFFMFETVLYRLAGISFFALFSFLLLYATADEQ